MKAISFAGLTGTGAVVLDFAPPDSLCGGATCYFSFLDGVSQGVSSTEPTLASDYNATPCSAPPCSATSNGRTASIAFEPDHITEDLLVSSEVASPQLVLQSHGFTGDLVIDAFGDIIYDNGLSDEWVEAIDTTPAATPEPSSLLLLSTGALFIFAFSRRRRTQLA